MNEWFWFGASLKKCYGIYNETFRNHVQVIFGDFIWIQLISVLMMTFYSMLSSLSVSFVSIQNTESIQKKEKEIKKM